eukprot:4034088-Prymnesium_polylepis.1
MQSAVWRAKRSAALRGRPGAVQHAKRRSSVWPRRSVARCERRCGSLYAGRLVRSGRRGRR